MSGKIKGLIEKGNYFWFRAWAEKICFLFPPFLFLFHQPDSEQLNLNAGKSIKMRNWFVIKFENEVPLSLQTQKHVDVPL